MPSFLNENKKKYHLQFTENSIHGVVGFSFTAESIGVFLLSVSNYCTIKGIKAVFVGHDGSEWPSTFSNEVIIKTAKSLGLSVSYPERQVTLPEFTWLVREWSNKKPALGLYITNDCRDKQSVSLLAYDGQGRPLSEREILAIVKQPVKITSHIAEDYQEVDEESLNIDLYLKYLFDKGFLTKVRSFKRINIDTMFGASESLATRLGEYLQMPVSVFNLQSGKPRINKYIAKPTGSLLKWYTTHPEASKGGYFFGIDGDGDSLGVYDLAQDLELNSSSCAMLLLKWLKCVKGATSGTVVLSRMLSFKVEKLAKLYGFDVVRTDTHLLTVSEEESPIFYADEAGRFWFGGMEEVCGNPLIALVAIAELCESLNKGPADIVDDITAKEVKKISYYNKVLIPRSTTTVKELIKALKASYPKATLTGKEIKELRLASYSRAVFKDITEEGLIDVYIESNVKDFALAVGKAITDFLKGKNLG